MSRTAVHMRKRTIEDVDYYRYEAILRWESHEYTLQTETLKQFATPKKLTEYVMSLVSDKPVSDEITEIKDYLKQMFESGRLVLQKAEPEEENNEVLDFISGF